MQLVQSRHAMLQLHLSDQQLYCLLRVLILEGCGIVFLIYNVIEIYSDNIAYNIDFQIIPHHYCPFVRDSSGDRWIPLTKGPVMGEFSTF